MLGSMSLHTGRPEEAVRCFRGLVEAAPEVAFSYHALASALVALGDLDEASSTLERALAIKSANSTLPVPDEAATLLNLGYLYEKLNKPERALDAYRRACAARPDFAQAYNNFGTLQLQLGRTREASAAFARALALAPEVFASFDDIYAVLLKTFPGLGEAVDRVSAAWPSRLSADEMLGPSGIGAIAGDPLFEFVLESTPVMGTGLERFLTCVRAAVLEMALEASPEVSEDLLAVACAVASQCFINEYVFADTAPELEHVERLKQMLTEALRNKTPIPPLWLAAFSSYSPLTTLPSENLLLERSWPQALNKIVTQQLREVHQERMLRDGIPRLTPVADETSVRVREQYEESPYPRWILVPSQRGPLSINHHLAAQFPGVPFRSIDDRDGLDILVAGCGSGHHPIATARLYAGARLLAIDLSLASLGYALRKTQELGVRNIEYGQGDILALNSLGRSFDLVDASGVLHHLADPMDGWRRLLELTRPHGLLRIGLYSELGRESVVAARQFIAERDWRATPADIRLCRQELPSAVMQVLAKRHDFFTMSECRDLLFHVEEHRFAIADIERFLAAHSLRFIGFDLGEAARQDYQSSFPSDRLMTDLNNWSIFEQRRPETFSGMYQFWCQKE
jgi:tetratricopeptide (TPR) repeat protein/SAM-dependent methyltransferase